MKKISILFIAAIFGTAPLQAQSLLTTPQEGNSLENIISEYVEPNTPTASYFEAVKDASFPSENAMTYNADVFKKDPEQLTAGLLAILLGDFGVHHFYTGQTLRGVLDILFCWTGIPAIIGLIEGIVWLCDDNDEWAERVAKWND